MDEQVAGQQIERQRRQDDQRQRDRHHLPGIFDHLLAQWALGHQQLHHGLVEVAGPHNAQRPPRPGQQRVDCPHHQGGQVALPHVGGHHRFGGEGIGQLDQLALPLMAIDDRIGPCRGQQPVGQAARQRHDVGHRIQHARAHHTHPQAIVEPVGAEIGKRGQVDHDFDQKNHRDDRGDELDREAGKPAGQGAASGCHCAVL